jgi:hypothetical protein
MPAPGPERLGAGIKPAIMAKGNRIGRCPYCLRPREVALFGHTKNFST